VPDVALKDLTGKTVRIAEYQGKVVLLDFWATYCDACHKAIPKFQKMSEADAAKGLEVLGISIDTDARNVPDYVKESGMKYRVLLDPGLDLARACGVRGLPATFLAGRDGKIRRQWVGYTDATFSEIESEVRAALQ